MEQFSLAMTGRRIKSRRQDLKITLEELGRNVGLAASTVHRYETGAITHPKLPVLRSIADALDVSLNWLTGESDVMKPYQSNMFSAELAQNVKIPIIGRVAAGLACHAEEYIEGYETASSEDIIEGEEYVYLRVKGDSMSPLIQENDLVLVRCQNMVDSGTYAVVIIDNEDGVVKKVFFSRGKIELRSENPYYPPRIFEGEDCSRIRIFGKVIESKRKF